MSTHSKSRSKAHTHHAAPDVDEKAAIKTPAPSPHGATAAPHDGAGAPAADPPPTTSKGKRRLAGLAPFAVLGVAAALVFGIANGWNAWTGAQARQETDDAQLRADITPLSTKVSGTVARVAVQDYQHVLPGDLLVELKNADYRAQVGQAAAEVEGAKAAIDNNRRQKELQDARIDAARTAIDAAQADISRGQAAIQAAYADERNAGAGVDAALATVASAAADVEVAQASIQAAHGNVEQAKASIEAAQANVEAAEATLKAAEAGVENARQNIQAVQATILGAQAEVVRTGKDRVRQTQLVGLGYQSPEILEQSVAAHDRARSTLSAEQAQLRQAQAALSSQQAQLGQATAAVGATQAAQRQARAALTSRQADLSQSEAALATREAALRTAKAQLEGRRSDTAKARAQLSLQRAALEQARAQLAGRGADLVSQQRQQRVLDAQGEQLLAELHAKQQTLQFARTNLQYTRILAPAAGMVSERKVRAGQLVSPGTQVVSLVENTLWIQANYKETQLTHVRPGDLAEATVDAFPGMVLRGRVEEIAPASGAQFALLPPDNATGNFTKIAQRIPVKIRLTVSPEIAARLRAGMSVIAVVTPSGSRRRWGVL